MQENEIQIRVKALNRERLAAQATVFQCTDMIAALVGRAPSMFDALVGEAFGLENAARLTEQAGAQVQDQPVAEPVKVSEAFKEWGMIEAQPDRIQRAFPTLAFNPLKFAVEDVSQVGAMRIYELGLNDIPSSNVSAFAYQLKVGHEDNNLILKTRIFVRFKGGGMYRYSPLHLGQLNNLVTIATTMAAGGQAGSTVGQYIANVIKPMADNDLILCEKLTPDGDWVPIQPKVKGQVRDTEKPTPIPRPTLPSVKATKNEWGGSKMEGEGPQEEAQNKVMYIGGRDPIGAALNNALATALRDTGMMPAAEVPLAPEVVEAQPETKSTEPVASPEAVQADQTQPVGETGPAIGTPIEAHAVEDAAPEEGPEERSFFLIANDPIFTDKGDVYEFQAGYDNGPDKGEQVLDTFKITVASEGGRAAVKAWKAGDLTDEAMYNTVLKRKLPEPPPAVTVAPEPEPEPEPVKDAEYWAKLFDVGATTIETVGQETETLEKVGDDADF